MFSNSKDKEPILFCGSSNPILAKEIVKSLGIALGNVDLSTFPDGETFIQIRENVRGRDVFVFQTIALKPNDYLVELLIMIDALKRASANSITVVIPYYGYSRQDRKDKPRVPITAKLVADLLETAGATRVLTADLHAGQLQGFFNIPVDNVVARPIFAEALAALNLQDLVVVAPDIGSVKITRAYARSLKAGMAIVDKLRISANEVDVATLIGNVNGKDVLLADDMCSTAGTLVSAAKACREKGAKRIFAVVTHGLFVGESLTRISESPIEALYVSNTIHDNERISKCSKIRVISIADLLAKAIRCIISKESLSSLYDDV